MFVDGKKTIDIKKYNLAPCICCGKTNVDVMINMCDRYAYDGGYPQVFIQCANCNNIYISIDIFNIPNIEEQLMEIAAKRWNWI